MADIAFYAPLKSPHHAVPSGEREMARNLMLAIGSGWTSGTVRLVSELRSHVANGDDAAQAALMAEAASETERLIAGLKNTGIALWVTYHNYYKAPDLLGPTVSAALEVPYVIVEASRARSRLSGPWARFAQAAEAASDTAALIFYVTELDGQALHRDQTATQQLVHLCPFLPVGSLPPETTRVPGSILSVGMFRGRDKLGSYQIIAETMDRVRNDDWRLDIAGDGPARPEIEALMRPLGDRVRLLGQLDRNQLSDAYGRASVFFWPGYNEAYGLVYLEAQAAGLPVVAQDRDGVRDVILPNSYPSPQDGPDALARMLEGMLDDPTRSGELGRLARKRVAAQHLLGAARDTFWQAAGPLIGGER